IELLFALSKEDLKTSGRASRRAMAAKRCAVSRVRSRLSTTQGPATTGRSAPPTTTPGASSTGWTAARGLPPISSPSSLSTQLGAEGDGGGRLGGGRGNGLRQGVVEDDALAEPLGLLAPLLLGQGRGDV